MFYIVFIMVHIGLPFIVVIYIEHFKCLKLYSSRFLFWGFFNYYFIIIGVFNSSF